MSEYPDTLIWVAGVKPALDKIADNLDFSVNYVYFMLRSSSLLKKQAPYWIT